MRNDAATWEELSRRRFDNVVISPGPGTPGRSEDFGICADALATPDLPILGVCLGHQGLAHVNHGAVVRTPGAVHGRISPVFHDESPLFAGIPQGFGAVRYHSLRVEALPEVVRRSAWTADGTVMGLSHRERPHWGVQFHPESICTEHGRRLLENFRDLSRSSSPAARALDPGRAGAPASAAGTAARRPAGLLAAHRSARRSGDRVRAALRRAALRVLARQQPRLGRAVALLLHRARAAVRSAGSCPTTPARGRVRARDAGSVRTPRGEHLQLSRARAGRPGLRRRAACRSTSREASSATSATRSRRTADRRCATPRRGRTHSSSCPIG